ncbi:MAG: tRNA dihydrouridine(20/20a) synthase DusA [Alphaproteobacteria bacterium]|nr:tRNA dihydrouridine(20/20a) synthase DusA [Alphaproteobacteria bacterium]MCB9930198.1 tRNA dihydrouridine(20/20a) synthase DusA [Alphaproteobacteria bacterium]
MAYSPHRFSVAPMMDWTDRHDRFFLRLLSRRALLYTEMVTEQAVRFGDRDRLLGYSPAEQPLALQLGGSDPDHLAEAARIGEQYGYDEINLNCGCPSDRVQSGAFGACLMAEPALVARSVAAMQRAVRVPVTVKCRIGIDHQDEETALRAFVGAIADAGVRTVIVHARKAWLKGLSPKDNRSIPPLKYDLVYRLKAERPDLTIILNGGIETLDQCAAHLAHTDGVMLGRAAYQNPYLLADVDARLFGDAAPPPSRHAAAYAMAEYADRMARDHDVRVGHVARHLVGLFQGLPGARAWRRHLSEAGHRPGATGQVIRDAAALVPEPALAAA